MSAARAKRLCPQAIVIRPRMQHYASIAREIRGIFERYTPLIEPLSLDEAFLDVTGSEALFGPSETIARRIKSEIREELQLVASVGVAPNKFLAKIASDLRKPDGFVVVPSDGVEAFLDPFRSAGSRGVGKVTGRVFETLAIRTIGQLRALSSDELVSRFGSSGEHYWRLARGIDDRGAVVPDREAKSISHETTFSEDIDDQEILRSWLVELAEQVGRRLRRHDLRGRTVDLKVRFSDFRIITRSVTLPEPTNVTQQLVTAGLDLLDHRLPPKHLPVRLLGFGVSGFDRSGKTQRLLFDDSARSRQSDLDRVSDQIVEVWSSSALRRAKGMEHSDE